MIFISQLSFQQTQKIFRHDLISIDQKHTCSDTILLCTSFFVEISQFYLLSKIKLRACYDKLAKSYLKFNGKFPQESDWIEESDKQEC